MARVLYPPNLVVDPTSGLPMVAARGAEATVVAVGTDTPLTLTEGTDDAPIPVANPVTVSSDGFTPTFFVEEGSTRAELVIGGVRTAIWSPEGLEASAAAAAADAETAATAVTAQVTAATDAATLAASYAASAAEDAALAESAAAGGVPVDADTTIAALISATTSAVFAALGGFIRGVVWDGTAWGDRPAGVDAGLVFYISTTDPLAPSPDDQLVGDTWLTHPDAA